MLQMIKIATHTCGHRGIVKSPIHLGDDEDFGLAEIQDIEQLALSKNRHYGMEDGATLAADQRRDNKLPPIGHLNGHDVAWANSQPAQGTGSTINQISQLSVSQAKGLLAVGPVGNDRDFVRRPGYGLIQKLIHRLVQPVAGFTEIVLGHALLGRRYHHLFPPCSLLPIYHRYRLCVYLILHHYFSHPPKLPHGPATAE